MRNLEHGALFFYKKSYNINYNMFSAVKVSLDLQYIYIHKCISEEIWACSYA
jgi:hypothetical protein